MRRLRVRPAARRRRRWPASASADVVSEAGPLRGGGDPGHHAHHVTGVDLAAHGVLGVQRVEDDLVGGHQGGALVVHRRAGVVEGGGELGRGSLVAAHVLDQAVQPRGQRLARPEAGVQDLLGVAVHPVDPVLHHGVDQRVAGREVPVEGAGADARALGDLVQGGVGALLAEQHASGLDDLVEVALGIGTQRLAGRLCWPLVDGHVRGHARATRLLSGDSLRIVLD